MKKLITKSIKPLVGMTLIETLVAMTILTVIFMIILSSFNSIIYSSVMVDARTAVRNESEFVNEFFKLYVKNADQRTLVCMNEPNNKSISWSPQGGFETYSFQFIEEDDIGRFQLVVDDNLEDPKTTILTYGDVDIHDVSIYCDSTIDTLTGKSVSSVSLTYLVDSTTRLGDHPAARNIKRVVTVALR